MQKDNSQLIQYEVNGLRVVHIQNQSFLTNIQFLTHVGSSSESSEMLGMAHILEHMFFKGSKNYPAGTSISRAANDIGGKMNAYTTYDHTVYYISILNENFQKGFHILSDMYQYPCFEPEEFKKELNPILSEYREHEDDPGNFLMERSFQKFFDDIYHPVIGTKESIECSTVEKMHAFKDSYYGSNNTLISIVGGIDPDIVKATINEMMQQQTQKKAPEVPMVTQKSGYLELTKPGIQEAYYNLFFPALPSEDPDRYKQDLMNYLLGGNDSALLFERIREELGMSCYGIYSWTMRNRPYSLLGISCGIAPNQLDILHKEINEQIKRLQDSLLQPEQLERAKASLRTSIAARSETSNGLNSLVSVPVLRGETEHPVKKALQKFEEVTLEDVMDQARKTLSGPAFHSILLPEME